MLEYFNSSETFCGKIDNMFGLGVTSKIIPKEFMNREREAAYTHKRTNWLK